jgi:hypothetical protein
MDSECGDADSGRICEGYQCVDGCRGADGNLCPSGEMCSSTDSSAGTCEPIEPTPECGEDADCGDAQSGRICEAESCVDGCRGQNGNGCPSDKMCTSTDSSVGECRPIKEPPEGTGGMGTGGMAPETGGAPASGGTDPATGGTPETTDDDLQPIARGGGIYCSTQLLPGGVPSWPAGLLLFAATLGVVRRRKRGERAA